MQGAIPNKQVFKKVSNKSDCDVLFSIPEHKKRTHSTYRPEEQQCWLRDSEGRRILEGFDMLSD